MCSGTPNLVVPEIRALTTKKIAMRPSSRRARGEWNASLEQLSQPVLALDVVSALITPPYSSENHLNNELRKFAGYMLKRNRRPPHQWRRRWVEVTLEGFRSASKVLVSRESAGPSAMLVLKRNAMGVVAGFLGVTLGPDVVEFDLEEPSTGFFRKKKAAKLRAIPGTTPDALIAALAALGWPAEDGKHRDAQALLLGLGDPRAARHLDLDLSTEARAIASHGVRPVVATEAPGTALPGGIVVPDGVAKNATFYVINQRNVQVDQEDQRDMDEETRALIDRAVASRVIDDFAAHRMRAQVPEGHSRDRLRELLGRRIRDVRSRRLPADTLTSQDESLDDDLDDDDDDDLETPRNDEDEAPTPEPLPDPPPRPQSLRAMSDQQPHALADHVRIPHRGRWVEARVVDREIVGATTWLTVRFRDGDVVERRVRDDSVHVRPTAATRTTRSLPTLPSPTAADGRDSSLLGGPFPQVTSLPSASSLPYSPRFHVSHDSDSDDDDAMTRPRATSETSPPRDHFASAQRPDLLRALSESRVALPITEAIQEHTEAIQEHPPDEAATNDFTDEPTEDIGEAETKDQERAPESDENGSTPPPPPGEEEDDTTKKQPDLEKPSLKKDERPRRFRRQISEHGSLSWEADVLDSTPSATDAKRGLKTETCEAVVPVGARPNSRLSVRVPGCTEPCIVVVPPEASPGSRLRFRFFRVVNEDGSTSCVRWSGFPHNDLSKAPQWRRDRLEQRLAAIRIPYDRIPRDQRCDIVVRRSRFLESYLASLPAKGKKWRYPWKIHYDGERGVDAGGVAREFWTDVSRHLWNPDLGLFKFAATDNLTYEISTFAQTLYAPEAAARLYRTAGRLVAKALLDRHIVSAALSRPLLKHILGQPVDFDDLQFVDAALHANLSWLLSCDNPQDVELLCQSATTSVEIECCTT